jgi:hypothetical protein
VLLPQNNGASIALATVPNATGTSGAVAVVAAQTVAFQSADIVLDRLSDLRREEQKQTTAQSSGSTAMAYAKMPVKADPISAQIQNVPGTPTVRPAVMSPYHWRFLRIATPCKQVLPSGPKFSGRSRVSPKNLYDYGGRRLADWWTPPNRMA